MNRLNEARIAVMLAKMRETYPTEVAQLEGHLEAIGGASAFSVLIEKVAAALAINSVTLGTAQPVLERGVVAMEKMASAEIKANELEERRQLHEHEIRLVKWRNIAVPSVTAVLGILGGIVAAMYGTGVTP